MPIEHEKLIKDHGIPAKNLGGGEWLKTIKHTSGQLYLHTDYKTETQLPQRPEITTSGYSVSWHKYPTCGWTFGTLLPCCHIC